LKIALLARVLLCIWMSTACNSWHCAGLQVWRTADISERYGTNKNIDLLLRKLLRKIWSQQQVHRTLSEWPETHLRECERQFGDHADRSPLHSVLAARNYHCILWD